MTHLPDATGISCRPAWLWAVLVAVALAGCGREVSYEDLTKRLETARKDNVQLGERVNRLTADVKSRDEHIVRLQGLGPKRLDLLFAVASVKLGRSSGVDLDEKPGDDGVRVYLKCIDRDGHSLKAAGDVTIQLFDLADDAKDPLVARYEFPVAEAVKHYSGGLMMNQYRFDCPWKSAPPKRPELTLRVTFTEYLTGKSHTAQKLITLNLPAK